MKIIWKGNKHTNKSKRDRYLPDRIVNHIVEGTAESCIDWFTNPNNKSSSAHFLVAKDGAIYQFVAIEEIAWAQGIDTDMTQKATATIVKERRVNPNKYCISIEHEGRYKDTKGELTDLQLKSTIWLHKYIIDYVKEKYNVNIYPDREHILGHYEINPKDKANCPGKLFPFKKIIEELNKMFKDLEGHWAKETIIKAEELGLVKGDGTDEFKPDRNITRAEATQMILNLYEKLKK